MCHTGSINLAASHHLSLKEMRNGASEGKRKVKRMSGWGGKGLIKAVTCN